MNSSRETIVLASQSTYRPVSLRTIYTCWNVVSSFKSNAKIYQNHYPSAPVTSSSTWQQEWRYCGVTRLARRVDYSLVCSRDGRFLVHQWTPVEGQEETMARFSGPKNLVSERAQDVHPCLS